MDLTEKHFASEADHRGISARELADLFLGEQIGHGIHRTVYEYNLDKSLVVKHASGNGFGNQIEWEIWEAVKDCPEIAKWFAPCVSISPCGLWLVQKRVEFPDHKEYPDRMPAYFTDFKYRNYGKIGKQFVACDYGQLAVFALNGMTKRMQKPHWFE